MTRLLISIIGSVYRIQQENLPSTVENLLILSVQKSKYKRISDLKVKIITNLFRIKKEVIYFESGDGVGVGVSVGIGDAVSVGLGELVGLGVGEAIGVGEVVGVGVGLSVGGTSENMSGGVSNTSLS